MKYLFPTALAAILLIASPALAQQGGLLQPPPNGQQQPRRPAAAPAKPVAPKPVAKADANTLPPGAKAFDSWVYSCTLQPGTDNQQFKGCSLRSNFVVEDQEKKQKIMAAGIVIGRMMAEKQPQMLVQLPLSSLLLEQPRILSSDGNAVVQLAWVACNQNLCLANATLADAQLAALANIGDTLSIAYQNQTGQQIKVDGSAKEIGAALTALSREK